jgi:hypothetical protein
MAPPTLTEVIERAEREQWPRLALVGPGARTGAAGGYLGELRRRGWSDPYLVIVPQPVADPADVVARLTRLSSLRELVLDYPCVGDVGAQAIAEHLTALTSLNLAENNIGDAGARAIAEHLTALTSLGLSNNNIGGAGTRAIATHLTALAGLALILLLVLGGTAAAIIAELRFLDDRSSRVLALGATVPMAVFAFVFLGYFSGLLKGPMAERLLNRLLKRGGGRPEAKAEVREAKHKTQPKAAPRKRIEAPEAPQLEAGRKAEKRAAEPAKPSSARKRR